MTAIGDLRERVDLYAYTLATSTDGDQTETWATYATRVPARVAPLQGRDRYAAQAIQANLAYRVTIRYRTDITAHDRVYWGGRKLEIHGIVNPEARDRFLVMDCSETS